MKKIEHHIYDNSEAGERQYQQTFKAEQRILQMFLSFFPQCYWVPFYPYSYPMFSQTDLLINQSEDNSNKDSLKEKNK